MPDELARGLDLRGAVGQAKAHGLVVEDGGAEARVFEYASAASNALRAMPTLCAAMPMRRLQSAPGDLWQ